MELTLDQKDALTELINIGYGRAAGALSELTGYRVSLEVPQVSMHEIHLISATLEQVMGSRVAWVSQIFTGPIAGNALLMLDETAAVALAHLLTDERTTSVEFTSSTREIITEVGNILLNACLGVFGNLLRVHVNFAVPQLHIDQVEEVLHSAAADVEEQLRYGLMIHTRFHVKARDVRGYLVIVLGIASLDRLMMELERWENRQME